MPNTITSKENLRRRFPMPFGYNGKILHVNLATRTWEIETPDPQWYRTYVGGSSLAAYYLLGTTLKYAWRD